MEQPETSFSPEKKEIDYRTALEKFRSVVTKDAISYEAVETSCEQLADCVRRSNNAELDEIYDYLSKQSLLARMLLAFQFESVNDTILSRRRLLYGTPLATISKNSVDPSRRVLMAYGNNRYYNLGVVSDGSPIDEPRHVTTIPDCQNIVMSNEHTIFHTIDDKIYGCGRLCKFMIGKENQPGFATEPMLIDFRQYCKDSNDKVVSVAAHKNGTVIVTESYTFYIGCFPNQYKMEKFERMAENCVRVRFLIKSSSFKFISYTDEQVFVTTLKPEDEQEDFDIFPLVGYFQYEFCSEKYLPISLTALNNFDVKDIKREYWSNQYLAISYKAVKFDARISDNFIKEMPIRLWKANGRTFFNWVEKIYSNEITLILNGEIVPNDYIQDFEVFPNGEIVVLTENCLARGKIEFWNNAPDGFTCGRNKTKERNSSSLSAKQMVVTVEEIPGTHGCEKFSASPDGKNIVFLIGKWYPKVISKPKEYNERSSDVLTYLHNLKKTNTSEDGRNLLMTWQSLNAFVLSYSTRFVTIVNNETNQRIVNDLHHWISFFEHFYHHFRSMSACEKCLPNIVRKNLIEPENEDESAQLVIAIFSKIEEDVLEERDNRSYGNISGIQRFLREKMRKFSQCDSAIQAFTMEFRSSNYFARSVLAGIMAEIERKIHKMVDDVLNDDDRDEFLFKCETSTEYNYRVDDIGRMIEKRIIDGDIFEDEISLDLIIRVDSSLYGSGKTVDVRTNRALFELSYPFAVSAIKNGVLDCTKESLLYYPHYIFSRKNQAVMSRNLNDVSDTFKDHVRVKKYQAACYEMDDLWYFEANKHADSFVPKGTETQDIWIIKTIDGVEIPCHKNLLLLHSRQITAMQRFNESVVCFDNDASPVINVEFNFETVHSALSALCDFSVLNSRKIQDIIGVLYFFDYYIMEEALDDTLDIVFAAAHETNIQYLYSLYEYFDEKILVRFQQRPHLIFMSSVVPPFPLLKDFCEIMESQVYYKREERRIEQIIGDESQEFRDAIYNFMTRRRASDAIFKKKVKNVRDTNVLQKVEVHRRKRLNSRRKNSVRHEDVEEIVRNIEEPIRPSVFTPTAVSKPIPIASSPLFSEDDFPASPNSLTSPLNKGKSPGGRFTPKGAKFRTINISPKQYNAWNKNVNDVPSTSNISQSPIMEDVFSEELRNQKKRSGKDKKIDVLPFIEMEQQAEAEIKQTFMQNHNNEALVTVERVTDEKDEDESPLWGMMPGLLRR